MTNQPVYEVTFEREQAGDTYWWSRSKMVKGRIPHGTSDGPHEYAWDELFNDVPVTVYVHGADNTELRAWEIARRDFPHLTFERPLADDEDE